jgi:hypothetical protein
LPELVAMTFRRRWDSGYRRIPTTPVSTYTWSSHPPLSIPWLTWASRSP